jgi:hypothetical protein
MEILRECAPQDRLFKLWPKRPGIHIHVLNVQSSFGCYQCKNHTITTYKYCFGRVVHGKVLNTRHLLQHPLKLTLSACTSIAWAATVY